MRPQQLDLYMFYLVWTALTAKGSESRARPTADLDQLRSNPILQLGDDGAFDENGLGEPAVCGFQWLLLDALHRPPTAKRCGASEWRRCARDGVRWDRTNAAPVFTGEQARSMPKWCAIRQWRQRPEECGCGSAAVTGESG